MQTFRMILLLGVVAAAVACRSPEGPYLGKANPESLEAAGKPVVLLNYDLSKRLAVDTPPVVSRNADRQLEVQVGLRNRTDIDTLQLQVQTLFFNEAGAVLYMEPGSPAPWTAVTISPNQTYYYKARALTPEAVRYTIRVRYAKGAQ